MRVASYRHLIQIVHESLVSQPDMMEELKSVAADLARTELYDYSVYRAMAAYETGEIKEMLNRLMTYEQRHIDFWLELGQLKDVRLSMNQRVKLQLMKILRRVGGSKFTLMLLEAMEHYGVTHYLELWYRHRQTAIGRAIREILLEELKNEDELVETSARQQVRSEDVRNMILGLNDGLVEVLGSIGGFIAAFGTPRLVALAATIVGVAGAISMAAGAYASVKSEGEVNRFENAKREVLEELTGDRQVYAEIASPWRSAALVGIFYIIGAIIPVAPYWFGASGISLSLVTSLFGIGVISLFLSMISGISFIKKMFENTLIAFGAAGVTYFIGRFAQTLLGTSV